MRWRGGRLRLLRHGYVPGQTLGERLREGAPLAGADVMRIMREVARALEYAHEHGIVHRDIKPDNILLEQGSGRVLVTDFGIARSTDSDDLLRSDPGRISGTAHFMSPEQAAGEPLDGRSDLYSLGVVGCLAVSGRLPFEARSVPAVLVRQATEAAMLLSSVAPGVPAELGAVIDRWLAMRREDRFEAGRRWPTRCSRGLMARTRCRLRCATGCAREIRRSPCSSASMRSQASRSFS